MGLKNCKVGMRVKFINKQMHEEIPEYYPPVGTIGKIIKVISPFTIYVQWSEETTSSDGKWYCSKEWIEAVSENKEMTDDEIWNMLKVKMKKNEIKYDYIDDFSRIDAIPLYSLNTVIKAVALAYKCGYYRGEKGRPFKYGDKNEN